MGQKDNREQIADVITKELEKATGLTWRPKIFNGTGTIEYMVEQYNIYFMFNVYNYEDMPRSVNIEKHSPVNISIDELYNLLDCINRICIRKHSLYFNLKEDRQIHNFMDLIDIEDIRIGNDYLEEASRDIIEKIDSNIKKGTLSVVDLSRMDKIDKHYREFLKDRDVLILDKYYDKFAILFDNE